MLVGLSPASLHALGVVFERGGGHEQRVRASIERVGGRGVEPPEDREAGRLADSGQVTVDDDALGSAALSGERGLRVGRGCHERDAVALGDRLTQPAHAGLNARRLLDARRF